MRSRARLCVWLALVLLAAPTAIARAQLAGPRVGVTAGLNFARLSFEDDEDVDVKMRTALVFGGFAAMPIQGPLEVELGALYSQQGTDLGEDEGIEGGISLSYLQLPLVAKIGFPIAPRPGTAFRPHAVFGGALGINVGCKVEAAGEGVSGSVDCDHEDVDLKVKTLDFSLIGGIGADVGPFTVGLRYWHGLTNVDDSEDAEEGKNRVISLTLSYSFPLRR